MNIRAAFQHNVADALGSIAVIVAGTVIIPYDWRLIDPLITLPIAGYILWQSVTEIGGSVRKLMHGRPPDLDTHAILETMRSVKSVPYTIGSGCPTSHSNWSVMPMPAMNLKKSGMLPPQTELR